jgi:hypothetical protein
MVISSLATLLLLPFASCSLLKVETLNHANGEWRKKGHPINWHCLIRNSIISVEIINAVNLN